MRLWLTGLVLISCCINRIRFFFSAHTSSACVTADAKNVKACLLYNYLKGKK